MHGTELAIGYEVAQQQQVVARQRRRHERAVALNQFRNSYCDMMGSADLYHYCWATGRSMEWLLDRAKWSDPRGMNGAFYERAVEGADYELLERVFFLP